MFKLVFKTTETTPFEINYHELLIWKAGGNEFFCQPGKLSINDDELGTLTNDPKIALAQNP